VSLASVVFAYQGALLLVRLVHHPATKLGFRASCCAKYTRVYLASPIYCSVEVQHAIHTNNLTSDSFVTALQCLQVQVTAAVADFLVNEARKNFHEPANLLQEQDLLIYNFCPEYTGKVILTAPQAQSCSPIKPAVIAVMSHSMTWWTHGSRHGGDIVVDTGMNAPWCATHLVMVVCKSDMQS